jgi:hypothetical protein
VGFTLANRRNEEVEGWQGGWKSEAI